MKKVLSIFNMSGTKPVSTPLPNHFKLFKEQSPLIEQLQNKMVKVAYVATISILMYAMVYTKSDKAYAIRVVSKCMSNQGKHN